MGIISAPLIITPTHSIENGAIIPSKPIVLDPPGINITGGDVCTGGTGGVPPQEPNLNIVRNNNNQIIRVWGNYTDYHITYDNYGKPITIFDSIKNITKTLMYSGNVFVSVVIS